MITSHKSPFRFLAASLLVSGLSFASIANAAKINITIVTDPATEAQIAEAQAGESESGIAPKIFPVTLEVDDEDAGAIESIKRTMEDKTSTPHEEQVLKFGNTPLSGKTLKDYGIKDQDKLDWSR